MLKVITLNFRACGIFAILATLPFIIYQVTSLLNIEIAALWSGIINALLYPAFYSYYRNPLYNENLPIGWTHALVWQQALVISIIQQLPTAAALMVLFKSKMILVIISVSIFSLIFSSIACHIIFNALGIKTLLFVN